MAEIMLGGGQVLVDVARPSARLVGYEFTAFNVANAAVLAVTLSRLSRLSRLSIVLDVGSMFFLVALSLFA